MDSHEGMTPRPGRMVVAVIIATIGVATVIKARSIEEWVAAYLGAVLLLAGVLVIGVWLFERPS